MIGFIKGKNVTDLNGPIKGVEKICQGIDIGELWSVPGAVGADTGGQADDGDKVEAATVVEKILPGGAIELVEADNNGNPAPVAAGGVNDGGGRGNVGGLGEVETEDVFAFGKNVICKQ